jgi:hypothetical protein
LPFSAIDTSRLYSWLRIDAGRADTSGDDRESLDNALRANDVVRRSLQTRIIFDADAPDYPGNVVWRVQSFRAGLAFTADDIKWHLQAIAQRSTLVERDAIVWKQLATTACWSGDDYQSVLPVARTAAAAHPTLATIVAELEKPRKPEPWELEQQQRADERKREKAAKTAEARAHFAAHQSEMRSGELFVMLPIARCYLGMFSDIDNKQTPPARVRYWVGDELAPLALSGLIATLSRNDLPPPSQIAKGYAEQKRYTVIQAMIAGACELLTVAGGIDQLSDDQLTSVLIGLCYEHLGDSIGNPRLIEHLEQTLAARAPAAFETYLRLLVEPFLEAPRDHVAGLHVVISRMTHRPLVSRLCLEWLQRYSNLDPHVERQLIDGASDRETVAALAALCTSRLAGEIQDPKQLAMWRAIGLITNFEATAPALTAIEDDDELLWQLRHFTRDTKGGLPNEVVRAPSLSFWVFNCFRTRYHYTGMPLGSSWGNRNSWDASEFLMLQLQHLAADASPSAASALASLRLAEVDSYSSHVRHFWEKSRKLVRERKFDGISVDGIKTALEANSPTSTRDLLEVVLHALSKIQQRLRGNPTDRARTYYQTDGKTHQNEDWCTDRLVEDLEPSLRAFGVTIVPQADMPNGKRADILISAGALGLPVECKGQWHSDLWTAPEEQLIRLYARDWRAEDCGLFIVYWFGAGFKLQRPPSGIAIPQTPAELAGALAQTIPEGRRDAVRVFVLDLTP